MLSMLVVTAMTVSRENPQIPLIGLQITTKQQIIKLSSVLLA